MLVPAHSGGMYETVLVPTDGSEHARRAADHACYLADLAGAEVHVVSVADVQAAVGLFDAGGVDRAFVERVEAKGEAAIDAIEGAVDTPLTTAVLRGTPSEAILEYADEHAVDLIAMGTHGRRGLGRLLLGSTTERLVRRSPVPVLAVGPGDRGR